MNISSSTLFHFMSKPEYLINILLNDFCPRFYPEDFSYLFPSMISGFCKIAIPMICFCDIPLSLIHEHMEEYGNYGIGMKKEWAIRNRINPVIYAIEKTNLTKQIDNILLKHDVNMHEERFPSSQDYLEFLEIISYIKPYKAIQAVR